MLKRKEYEEMTFDTFLKISGFALLAICIIGDFWCKKNVYLKYKDQRVGVRTKWWRR